MRRSMTATLAVTTLLALGSTALTAQAAPMSASGSDRSGAYIVVLNDGAAPAKVASDHSARHGAEVDYLYRAALKGYAARMSATAAERVANDSRVQFVQRDGVVRASAQTTPTGINRSDAELSPTATIDGLDERVNVDVAVIDTLSLIHI